MKTAVRRLLTTTALAAALAAATAGCAADTGSSAARSASAGPSASAGYPVSLRNCGRTLTIDAAPTRVVSLWQSTTEMLLALGLRDRIVAVAGDYAPFPSSVAAEATGLHSIGSSMGWPSKEVLLSEHPDFVAAQEIVGFAFDTSKGYASVAQLEQAGATVYGANICDSADAVSTKTWNVDTAARTIGELGRVFGVSSRADALVAKLDAEKQAVVAAVKGKPAVKVAYFNGGTGPLIVLAGGVNAFPANSIYVSKEAFAASDADVVLVGTFPGQSFATEKAYLERNFPNLPAVKAGRISEVPVAQTDSSISVMVGLTKMANAIHPGLDLPVPSS